jgi:hypothetical protein
LQAVLQQIPVTQLPLRHCEPEAQAMPLPPGGVAQTPPEQ